MTPAHRSGQLSERALKRLPQGRFASENLGYGYGSLEARRTGSGIRYYYRGGPGQKRTPLPCGPSGLSLEQARERAWALARPAAHRGEATLGNLVTRYADHLQAQGKPSAQASRALAKRHIQRAHPRIWVMPAQATTAHEMVAVIEPLAAAGKHASARKLRSFLHAAFNAALDADYNVSAGRLRGFGLSHNPVALVRGLVASDRAGERALSVAELRAYWRHIDALEGAAGAALRFHLLTGCQRLMQLARARDSDLSPEGLMLHDRKGQRARPRPHLVPLTEPAMTALAAMARGGGEYLFTLDGGKTGAHRGSITRHVRRVAQAMVAAGETDAPFTVRDLRRSVESRLAEAGIPKEVRGQLQSHGLSGVQERNYSRYDYLSEKIRALETLWRLLGRGHAGEASEVA